MKTMVITTTFTAIFALAGLAQPPKVDVHDRNAPPFGERGTDPVTEVLFCFDTEDFTNPRSADGAKELAELFTSEGITAHFVMVGYFARALVERGRYDVIEALKPHLKLSHTLMHSVHPNTSEASETPDLEDAFRVIRPRETLAVGMVAGVTGADRIWGGCPPGSSESAAAYYTWAELGLPFYVGADYTYNTVGEDVWFCNLRQIPYGFNWEWFQDPANGFTPEKFLDWVARRRRIIVYCHPNRVHAKTFWDLLNYHRGNNCEWGKWKISEERSAEDVKSYLETIRTCLRRMKADPRFRIVTVAELDAAKKPRREIRRGDIPAIRASLRKAFGPVREPASWSISDCFVAAVRLLRGEESYLPALAYGFRTTPKGIKEPATVRREDLVRAARTMDVGRFLPTEIAVGNVRLGPADFLFAALEALETEKDEIAVSPREDQRGGFGPYPALKTLSLKGRWLFTKDFEDRYVSEAIRNQIWTLRYE